MKACRNPPTLAQRRQRQLSWLLYITEGYLANVQAATQLNEWTICPTTVRRLNKACEASITAAEQIRQDMQGLE